MKATLDGLVSMGGSWRLILSWKSVASEWSSIGGGLLRKQVEIGKLSSTREAVMMLNNRPVLQHNRTQTLERLAREIAGLRKRLDGMRNPQTAQAKRIATMASRSLVRRERDLVALLARPVKGDDKAASAR